MSGREKGDRKIPIIEIMFIHYLTYLFLFRIALTEKYKSVKAIEDDFYDKVIEAKCSGNFKLKAGYTAEEKRV